MVKKVPVRRNLVYAVFLVYCTLVVSVTFFPMPIDGSGFDTNYNFIPFSEIVGSIQERDFYALRNVAGNVIMFIPLGILLPFLWPKKKFWQYLLIIAAATVGIELMQGVVNLCVGVRYRSVDIDDVILNTAGGVLGYLVYRITPSRLKGLFEN
ncbi:MAG: VanZ family protein [Clostridiales bacterium]|nr:VanZ family protein [Clostridiales bacterium]